MTGLWVGLGSERKTVYKFTPPFVYELPLAYNRLMIRCLTPRGVTVGLKGSQFVEFDYPLEEELRECDKFWRGGYVHYIDDVDDANALIAAGYDVVEI